jgi:hypothetical protein
MQALVTNLRNHGVLFYRDSVGRAEARAAQERERAAGERRTGRGR